MQPMRFASSTPYACRKGSGAEERKTQAKQQPEGVLQSKRHTNLHQGMGKTYHAAEKPSTAFLFINCTSISLIAVIAPIGKVRYRDDVIVFGDGGIGPLCGKLYETLVDIQYGRGEDVHGWSVSVEGNSLDADSTVSFD